MDILITRPIPESAMQILRQRVPKARLTVLHGSASAIGESSRSGLEFHVTPSTAAIICTLADNIDGGMIHALPPSVRVIATYAVGTNNIDVAAATARGIWVANTPDVLTQATAEIAIGLMLMCCRRMGEGERLTREGRFVGWSPLFHLGRSLFGKTVGIVGAGRIGQCVGRSLAKGFGCSILYHSPNRRREFEALVGAKRVPFEQLLEESDFVSLHCPLTPKTKHLIDSSALSKMRSSAYLINTARGPVVDEGALALALEGRVIAGAGLDVYEREPEIHPLLYSLENVALMPHLGSATIEAREQMGRMCAEAVADALDGNRPKHCVNV